MRLLTKMSLLSAVLFFSQTTLADSTLLGSGTSIGNNANKLLLNALNLPIPFVTSPWSMLASYYNQNSSFAPADLYDVDVSVLSGISAIKNTSFGTLEVHYGPMAPGPMANNGYALAPTRVTLHGNTFYVYELPQCFTNIVDSQIGSQAPKEGTPSMLFSQSNLGVNCVYAGNPYAAAIAVVQGAGSGPTQPNGVSA